MREYYRSRFALSAQIFAKSFTTETQRALSFFWFFSLAQFARTGHRLRVLRGSKLLIWPEPLRAAAKSPAMISKTTSLASDDSNFAKKLEQFAKFDAKQSLHF
jgi:hypothetical protein